MPRRKFKYKEGDIVVVLAVEDSYMNEMIGKPFEINRVDKSDSVYCYSILDEDGDSWWFTEEQLDFFKKDQEYFKREKSRIIEKMKNVQKEFDNYQKELLEFLKSEQKEKSK